jgi:hypothetical protein
MGKKRLQRERKRCFSSLFCLVSLLFGNDLSILRDELTANLSLSRAFDRVSSLSFFSSRERLEKEKEVRRESLFAFAPFWGRSAKKKFYDARQSGKNREEEESRAGGEKQKIPNNERVCWPSYSEEEEEENRYYFRKNNNNNLRGVNLNKTHAGTRPFDDDIAVLVVVSGTLSR